MMHWMKRIRHSLYATQDDAQTVVNVLTVETGEMEALTLENDSWTDNEDQSTERLL